MTDDCVGNREDELDSRFSRPANNGFEIKSIVCWLFLALFPELLLKACKNDFCGQPHDVLITAIGGVSVDANLKTIIQLILVVG